MPNRAQRRAAERQAQKLAVKANKTTFAEQTATDAVQSRGTTCTSSPETMSATASVGGSDQPLPPDTFKFQDLVDEINEKSEARRNATRATPGTAPTKVKPNLP